MAPRSLELANSVRVAKNSFISSLDFRQGLLAAVVSGATVQTFDASSLCRKATMKLEKPGTLTSVKFVDDSSLMTTSTDGFLRFCDLRTNQLSFSLSSTTSPDAKDELKSLLSCDVDLDAKIVCAGTESFEEDAFILFWDVRNSKELLGGYWESHSMDVTQVQFHPEKSNILASSALDGLVNVFDLKEATEEDALISTMNAECAVNYLSWVPRKGQEDRIALITTDNAFQLWDQDEAEPCEQFTPGREEQSDSEECENQLFGVLLSGDDPSISVLSSSNQGDINVWDVKGRHIKTLAADQSAHRDLAKFMVYDRSSCNAVPTFWTSGDDGYICRWVEIERALDRKVASTVKTKIKSSAKSRKPY